MLELMTSMRRHGMTAAAAVGHRRAGPRQPRPDRGRRPAPAAGLRLAPRRGRAAAHRPGRRRAAHHHGLGQPPDRRRARDAARAPTPTCRSGPGSAPTSGSATAGRCGSPPACSTSTSSTAATCSATAAAAPRATATWSSSAAAPPTASASRPARARPGCKARAADRRARRPGGARPDPLAVLGRRQAAAVRRAPAHAGLDALPARATPGRPRSATSSTCGSATPRRRSTASTSPEVGGRSSGARRVVLGPEHVAGHDARPGRARRPSG